MAATVESNGRVGLLAGPVANPAGLFWFALTILSTLPLFRFGLAGLVLTSFGWKRGLVFWPSERKSVV